MATQAVLQRQVDGCVADIKRHQQALERAKSPVMKSEIKRIQSEVFAQIANIIHEANTAGYTLNMPLWIEGELRERRKLG